MIYIIDNTVNIVNTSNISNIENIGNTHIIALLFAGVTSVVTASRAVASAAYLRGMITPACGVRM